MAATGGIVLFDGEAPREPTVAIDGPRRPPPPGEIFHVRGNLLSKQSDERFTPVISQYEGYPDDDHFEKDLPALDDPPQDSQTHTTFLSSLAIIVGALIGIGAGLGLSKLDLTPDAIAWISLPGHLFVRALRCAMVPMVFCSMAVAIAEVVVLNKTSILSWRTAGTFFLTSFLAVVQGMVVAGVYNSLVTNHKPSALIVPSDVVFEFKCHNHLYVASSESGDIGCAALNDSLPTTHFSASDINGVLSVNVTLPHLSLTKEVISIINLIVPQNIFRAMCDGSLLSVIAFALPLGFAIARSHRGNVAENNMLNVLRQGRNAMLIMIHTTLRATPVAVAFLIMSAIVSYEDTADTMVANGGYLIAAFLTGVGVHIFVTLPFVLLLFTRKQPFTYVQQLFPAYVFAFGCASSMAALPVAVTVIQQTRQVSRSLAQLVMILGTPTNMNAAGLYHPVMVVFLATMAGQKMDTPQWIVLFFVSLVSSIGTAPVPNAGLVMLLTVWKTVFPSVNTPQSFVFLVAIDFIFDRVRTAVNVNGNMVATRILAKYYDERDGVLLYVQEQVTSPLSERHARHTQRSSPSDHPHTLLRTPNHSRSSSHSSDRRVPPPPEGSGIRTNFTSTRASVPGDRPFEVYEDPIMEEYFPDKLGPPPLVVHGSYSPHSANLVNSISIVIGATVGIGLGVGLMQINVDGGADWPKWLALPGDLFVRALRCLIVPMVFTTMAVAVAEVTLLNKTSILTWRTGGVFFFTSFVATLQGMTVAVVYHKFATHESINSSAVAVTSTAVALKCANNEYLSLLPNGSVACTGVVANATASLFTVKDVNHVLTMSSKTTLTQLSLTDQVIAIVNLVVPDNIFASFASGSLLSIIMFALPLGVSIAKSHTGDASSNVLLNVLRQARNALLVLINAVLTLTPVAVLFLLASAIVSYKIKQSSASDFGYVFLAFLSGVGCHVIIVMPLILFIFTRSNPYSYLRQLFPAYVFAFGCASSMATLPVAVTVIHQTRQVSRSLAQLVMCLGTPVNMNSAGIYQPLMTVFMAHMSGMQDQLGVPQFVVLFFVSLVGSMGTAPVPNAGLVMLITVWKTVFPSSSALPPSFAMVMAVDFIFDRIRTMTNVNGNMVVAGILAERFDVDAASVDENGIYLYHEHDHQVTPTPAHLLHATPSSASSASSGGRRAPHHEPLGIRTNFTSSTRHDSLPNTPEYEFPDPIMEEVDKLPLAVHGNFDPRLGADLVSSLSILIAVAVGVGLGIGLKVLEISKDTALWLALPGSLFVRALRCLIVPMVFTTMTVSIAEISILKNTALLSWRTAGVFFLTSFLAAIQGMVVAISYHSLFTWDGATFSDVTTRPMLAFQCTNKKFLETFSNGSVACSAVASEASESLFQVTDVNNLLRMTTPLTTLSLTQQVISIIELAVPENIFNALTTGSLLSIIMFALPLGVAVAKSHGGEASGNYLLNVFRQARNALLILIHIVLRFTPVAIVFLLCEAVLAYDASSAGLASHGGYLLLAFLAGVLSHVTMVLPLLLALYTRCNPYTYMRQLFPAYVFAFGCASSMATLPVAVTVVHQTRCVSRSLAQLILCLGTPINMNAAGLYQPVLTVFMLHMSGNANALGTPQLIVLFFVSLVGSMGTAPVPNAGLVMLMTVWKTVFPSIALPPAFVYVVAIDFLFDRVRTAVNVNGNMIVTRILAAQYEDTISLDEARTPGIYLYVADGSNGTPNATKAASQSSSTLTPGSNKPPPPEPLGVRTNFTTAANSAGQAQFVFDDPIMEEHERGMLAPHAEYDPRGSGFVSSLSVVIGAALGVGLGLLLANSFEVGVDTRRWLALPGDLFVRALRCLIVPLVFCSMSVSVAEVVLLKKTSILTWRTAAVFFLTSLLATIQGMVLAFIYHSMFTGSKGVGGGQVTGPVLALQCANGNFLNTLANGSLMCSEANHDANSTLFEIKDVNNVLSMKVPLATLTLTKQAIAILELMVPDNIFSSMAQGSLLSIIMFALPLGVAIARSSSDASDNHVLNVLRQARNSLLLICNAVLRFTPVAVCFLICNAIVAVDANSSTIASQGAYLILTFFSGVLCHVLIVMPLILFIFTRINPYSYIRQLVPAYVFAFGCSSSMAALPVAVTVVHQTRQVSRSLAQMILCLGTPVNLNAPGLYFPVMVVFLVNTSGLSDLLGVPQMVVLFFVSLLASMGTAPVPNAALVMLMTVWKTVFPNVVLPHSFVYIVAVDFILDRICTMCNLNGNMIVTRILAEKYNAAWAHIGMSREGIYLYVNESVVSPAPVGSHQLHVTPGSVASTHSTDSKGCRRPQSAEPLGMRTNFSTRSNEHTGAGTPPLVYDDPILEETHDAKNLVAGNFDSRSSSIFVNSIAVVIGAGVGVGLGILLAKLDANTDVQQWMSLPGDLFVRALRCLVVPLVFCSMTVSIAEVVVLNRTSVLTWRTVAVFFTTSSLAAVQGMVVALVFRALYVTSATTATAVASNSLPLVGLKCANGLYLQSFANGSVACVDTVVAVTARFEINDINHVLSIQSNFQQLSLTDQVIAIINLMVSANIFESLADGSLLSIIMFALPFGVAIAKSHIGDASGNHLLLLMRQSRNALLSLINAVLRFTPFAVLFLVSSSIVTYNSNAASFVSQAGYLALAFISGVACHVLITLPLVLFLFTHINPYNYLRQLFPAYVFAFGCSSSMATLPVAVTVIHQTRQVTASFGQLIMCLGTPVNTNAAGLYYPLMTVFLACGSGNASALGVPQLVVLFFVSLLGSMGTAPVPNAALVMLMTVWKTVLPSIPLPSDFVYVVAIDFLFDRICTMTNVNGNMVATRILATQFDDSESVWSASDTAQA
ncbi:dicarboxylate/amino acid:cation (Na or H) symporter (DAACS) family protein [Achlya hypogyna]|uniref:Dicarboxylate/amino acid:cation (Na or H) symporter (DAACS) family protein n=1 Tax=Achlya hypogyna TaxID=1202772 RepID=A0A1V9YQ63_ACHHY|nr:dicarboxylate/amino acid:cation (Na or H) symporter (DAACS) family protein [Achlya hypogyna]